MFWKLKWFSFTTNVNFPVEMLSSGIRIDFKCVTFLKKIAESFPMIDDVSMTC